MACETLARMIPKWPGQPAFRSRVREYAKANGLLTPKGANDLVALGKRFGIKGETLRQFLQNRNRRAPGFPTLLRIATEMGCDVVEFLCHTSPVGLDPKARSFVDLMTVLAWELTPEERAPLEGVARLILAKELPGKAR